MDYAVREAGPDDGPDLLALWHGFTERLSAFDERYRHKESADERWLSYFESQLVDSKYGVVFVAESDSEILGVLEARVMGNHPIFRLENHGYVNGLYVRDAEQREAIGGALLDAAHDWFTSAPRAVDFYRVDVIDGDEEMAEFFADAGFSAVEHVYERRDD